MKIPIASTVRYGGFGFIPSGSFWTDLSGKLFGARNLLKRLQAREVMAALDIRGSDCVLDFGCGSGYMTVEMAKSAGTTYGLDAAAGTEAIPVPDALGGRLEFRRTTGTAIPFPEACFDRVLASEVLPMFPDPPVLLSEIRRVLKPGGRLVIVNGVGHPAIRRAFHEQTRFFRFLRARYSERMPKSYEDYCAQLQESFGTAQRRYFSVDDMLGWLKTAGLFLDRVTYAPGWGAYACFSWSQFLAFVSKGTALSQDYFVPKFLLLSLVDFFDRRRHSGGAILVATRPALDR